ncbi:MAG: penicillin-binding protein 2 [Actinomycetota bacterium]|nr:penicillin-binding protein 2 [Actinomycetota bacterium]
MIIVAAFVAMFSRLWYLQVLAVDEFKVAARDNRVRIIESEPPRGRILSRGGKVLVENKRSLAIALERDLLANSKQKARVLVRLSQKLDLSLDAMYKELDNVTVSPYKALPVAFDVSEEDIAYIEEHPDKFPGVVYEEVSSRNVVVGDIAAHVIGYTNEISKQELKTREWKGYEPGDIIGKAGVERSFDRYLRGSPRRERVVVDSVGEPIGKPRLLQEEQPGSDIMLTIAPRIQRIAQSSLTNGVNAARGAGYGGTSGAAVVMDPNNGDVLAMASYPTYNAEILEDGISEKDAKKLGLTTPNDHSDDAWPNRPIQGPLQPGSTFKAITATAALSLDVVGPYDYVGCPGTFVPPGTYTEFYNWTSSNIAPMDLVHALEISCNTVFFDLGWRMESRWGQPGDGQYQFQRFARAMGFGHETGIRLPYEHSGIVPDPNLCEIDGYCTRLGYLPGYTVNMAVGQGDLLVTPLQMAVAYSAIANGGAVITPRIVKEVVRTDVGGEEVVVESFEPDVQRTLPLDPGEIDVVRQGLHEVVNGPGGTANDAFVGFPYEVSGKTGTAQVGESEASHAWFISYGPSYDPQYVVAVYVEKAGHGGESAAPIAREIYEGIFSNDFNTSVSFQSGAYD